MGNKRRYAYNPVGMDAYDVKSWHPTPGDSVVFSNQGGGVTGHRGRGGLHNYRYVEGADSGQFHGMVLKSSLVPMTKKNPQGKADPLENARAASLINDRRIATP